MTRYIFNPNPKGDKVKDAVRGFLYVVKDEKATIATKLPILTTDEGITDYIAPVIPTP
jgi:hypothetical protein